MGILARIKFCSAPNLYLSDRLLVNFFLKFSFDPSVTASLADAARGGPPLDHEIRLYQAGQRFENVR